MDSTATDPMTVADDEAIPNFDRDPNAPTTPKRFSCDGEVFECAPVLPAGATRDLAKLAKATSNEQVILFGDFLDTIMLPDSAQRFAKRLRDTENPITDKQVSRVVMHLIRAYGHRPTTPASSSQNGAGAGGES